MIEVNRRLYLDEASGVKTSGFDPLKRRIRKLLSLLAGF